MSELTETAYAFGINSDDDSVSESEGRQLEQDLRAADASSSDDVPSGGSSARRHHNLGAFLVINTVQYWIIVNTAMNAATSQK